MKLHHGNIQLTSTMSQDYIILNIQNAKIGIIKTASSNCKMTSPMVLKLAFEKAMKILCLILCPWDLGSQICHKYGLSSPHLTQLCVHNFYGKSLCNSSSPYYLH